MYADLTAGHMPQSWEYIAKNYFLYMEEFYHGKKKAFHGW